MAPTLAALVKAEDAADAQRRAVGCIPEVLRPPGAAHDAYIRWQAAHQALRAALTGEAEPDTGG